MMARAPAFERAVARVVGWGVGRALHTALWASCHE